MKKETFIKLKRLGLKNFKGVFDQNFTLNGSTDIYGANETGKSTFLTAFLWLFTGKDEFDRQDYEIKNTKKLELNGQGHEVEGVFDVNDKEVTLKRIYREKWVKAKGAAMAEFKGHYTEYFVNDVECGTASEYKSRVDEIIPAELLKMITNPMYFNSLEWKDQRRGLIKIAGEVTDADIFKVITSPDKDFTTLMMVLRGGKSIDDYKAEIGQKINKLKKSAAEYAPRIDEAKRGRPEDKNWDVIENNISTKVTKIASIDELINDAVAALTSKQKGVTDKKNLLYTKQSALKDIRNKIRSGIESDRSEGPGKITAMKQQVSGINENIIRLEKDVDNKKSNIQHYEAEVKRLDEIIAAHRVNWISINKEEFSFDDSKCECPTCKQALPAEQIDAKKEEMLKNFNKSVADRKAEEVRKSDQRKLEKKQAEESIASVKEEIENIEANIISHKGRQAELNEKLEVMIKENAGKVLDNIEVATDALMKVNADALNLQDEIAELEKEIAQKVAALSDEDDQAENKTKRAELQKELDALRSELSLKAVIEAADNRIAQLIKEEEATAQQIATLEQQDFEIETYTRAKMDIIQARVNSLFNLVSFRLFDKQVNGQIVESCVCEYKGVPFPTLNTAAKLQAGLDVLETFSNFYGIHAPVICDNRESVSWIPASKSQIISLFVSEQDDVIRVVPAQMKKAS